MTSNTQQEDKKKKKKLLIFLILFILLDIILLVVLLGTHTTLAPDYAPVNEEKYAEDIGDDGDKKLDQAEGGGAVSLTYSTDVDISLDKKLATLFFANPSKSNQDMVLQIVVHDVVVAQSGTISPGKQIGKMDLLSSGARKLQAGGYDGKFVVLYYQPDTHEKTIVNTDIPVKITVR
ncbi:MAG: hypothetical protein UEP31_04995 [Anaerovoracaceae bacterium]|nr:hypothetical protein [Anaerovoracaceae bacterium]